MNKQEIIQEIKECIEKLSRISFHTKHTQEAHSQVSTVKWRLSELIRKLEEQ